MNKKQIWGLLYFLSTIISIIFAVLFVAIYELIYFIVLSVFVAIWTISMGKLFGFMVEDGYIRISKEGKDDEV